MQNHLKMPQWTPEKLKQWAKEQGEGIQYFTGYGPVYCPPRNWENDTTNDDSRGH